MDRGGNRLYRYPNGIHESPPGFYVGDNVDTMSANYADIIANANAYVKVKHDRSAYVYLFSRNVYTPGGQQDISFAISAIPPIDKTFGFLSEIA